MRYVPFFLELKGKQGLIVGGGEIAARKARRLIDGGMQLTIVAPHISATMRALASSASCVVKQRPLADDDVKGMFLIVAATDRREVNRRIAKLANAQSSLVNIADEATEGNLLFPSLVDRHPIQIAISAGGTSPSLSRLLRSYLEGFIPRGYTELANLLGRYRNRVKEKYSSAQQCRAFWDTVLRGRIADAVFAGRNEEAEAGLQALLASEQNADNQVGEIYLVGAGPGDPDLLTIKALRLMQQADVVVYDRLVSDSIHKLLRPGVEKIYAGKQAAKHAMSQADINQLLVDLAKQGKKVLRLKGGDPFIFGRGGEEIETLFEQGIPFQIVPGITAALGCAAYSGIPLTHRDYAQSCVFVTGHRKDGSVNLNWRLLCQAGQTLVFYMGLLGLEHICQALIENGMPPTTPIALIMHGTLADQKIVISDLSNIVSAVQDQEIEPPTLLIVGKVVELYNKLQWY
ncbi:MAG: uroporphyrinogen-III C-methyltransferase [Chromatiales bacterium]|nr:uroporphyrinogen-III C-methyltransferase [Chromatiales bacterium]